VKKTATLFHAVTNRPLCINTLIYIEIYIKCNNSACDRLADFLFKPKNQWGTNEIDMTGKYKAEYALKKADAETAILAKQKKE